MFRKRSIGVYSLENFDDRKESVNASSQQRELVSRVCLDDDRKLGVDRSSDMECAKASTEEWID